MRGLKLTQSLLRWILTIVFLVAGLPSTSMTSESPAPESNDLPFTSEEDFDYKPNDGGLISFAAAPSLVGMISRPFGVTPTVRSIEFHHLKDKKKLSLDESYCREVGRLLHGMDTDENENFHLWNVEVFRSRFGRACEARVLAKAEHVEFREYSYAVNIMKGQTYAFVYKSRQRITEKEADDFRAFLRTLK